MKFIVYKIVKKKFDNGVVTKLDYLFKMSEHDTMVEALKAIETLKLIENSTLRATILTIY